MGGAHTITHNAISPVRNEDIHKWVSAAHDIDTQNGLISARMASINPWLLANQTRMIILPYQIVLAGNVDSLAIYIGIVPGLIQRPNTLNDKWAIIGHETVEAPNNRL